MRKDLSEWEFIERPNGSRYEYRIVRATEELDALPFGTTIRCFTSTDEIGGEGVYTKLHGGSPNGTGWFATAYEVECPMDYIELPAHVIWEVSE